ncbi:MAG TPA: HDOD domain-containing protein [Verrucomicrobiae bacterium]|nr:HDOD domain-containing protein [Verrucomicrobiae bacterium]
MTARQLIERVKHLPPAPHSALRLVSLLGRSGAANDEIIEVLKCDNVLTAKLLSACNSSWLGLEEPVGSVDEAVLLLGHGQILQMVLNIAFGSTMAVALPLYATEAKALWRHSLLTAAAAEAILQHDESLAVEPAVGFTAGLLHDFGKLVLNEALPVQVQFEIRAKLKDGSTSRADAEREVIRTDHAEAGACLLESWKLPANIVEAVGNHHKPVLIPTPKLSAIINLANGIAHQAEPEADRPPEPAGGESRVAEILGLSESHIQSVMGRMQESFERMEHFLSAA